MLPSSLHLIPTPSFPTLVFPNDHLSPFKKTVTSHNNPSPTESNIPPFLSPSAKMVDMMPIVILGNAIVPLVRSTSITVETAVSPPLDLPLALFASVSEPLFGLLPLMILGNEVVPHVHLVGQSR